MYKEIEEIYSAMVLAYYSRLFAITDKDLNNLSATDISILEIIYHKKSLNYSELAQFVNMSLPNLTYRINNLIDKGHVMRMDDPDDKRKHRLIVTDKFIDMYCIDNNEIKWLIGNVIKNLDGYEMNVIEKIVKHTHNLIVKENE